MSDNFSWRKSLADSQLIRQALVIGYSAGMNVPFGTLLVLAGWAETFKLFNITLYSIDITSGSVVALSAYYFLLGIGTATIGSFTFKPKRLISPLDIQLLTILVFPIGWLVISDQVPSGQWHGYLAGVVIFWVTASTLFLLVGWTQDRIVRYLVGMNGTKDDTSNAGMLLDCKLEVAVLKLTGLFENLRLSGGQLNPNTFLIQSDSSRRRQVFLALTRDLENAEKTQLALVTYEKKHYGIVPDVVARDMNVLYIRQALTASAITPHDETKELLPAHVIAYEYALGIVEPRALLVKRLPRQTQTIIILLAALLAGITLLKIYANLPDSLFYEFLFFGMLGLIIDIVPLIRWREHLNSSG